MIRRILLISTMTFMMLLLSTNIAFAALCEAVVPEQQTNSQPAAEQQATPEEPGPIDLTSENAVEEVLPIASLEQAPEPTSPTPTEPAKATQ